MGEQLKQQVAFDVATEKDDRNIYHVDKYVSGPEDETGVYATRKLTEEQLKQVVETLFMFSNNSGSTIPKGTPVLLSNVVAGIVTVEPYENRGYNNYTQIFVAKEDVLNTESGLFVSKGLIEDFDTSLFSIGEPLFYNYDSQTITNVESNTVIFLGLCITSSITGQIFVTPVKDYNSPKVQSIVSNATVTPFSTNDLVEVTAQVGALTVNNPSGIYANGQNFLIRLDGDGSAITFDTKYVAFGSALPTTTTVSKTTLIGATYNSNNDTFECLNSVQQ